MGKKSRDALNGCMRANSARRFESSFGFSIMGDPRGEDSKVGMLNREFGVVFFCEGSSMNDSSSFKSIF
jgi:hypothetical protein